jgi:HD-GYP domain-containing protein (c-di-GMP phosphodiesterase class II)
VQAPVAHAWRREVVVEGQVVGLVAVTSAEDHEPADLLEAAAHVLAERLRAELEKNALAGEILTKLQELNTLYEVSANLANARDVAAVGNEVLSRAMGTIAPDWAAFVAYDPERSQFRIMAVMGARDGLARGWRVVEQDSHVWIAMNSGEPVLVPEVTEADRARLRRDIGPIAERATSLLAVPTCAAHQPLGALVLLAGPTRPAFTSVDAKLLMAMASQAAVAAGHLRLYEGSKEMFLSTVWSLASAIDAKDAYTHGHSQRVARYAAALGRAVGFDEQEVERLELSAVLHDVGKIGVPEIILNKPDRLTAAEMAVMKTHPQKGAEILSSIRAMRDIVPGVLHHHERFDGLGYPNGLKAHNIPLHARIILVADTFDAMTSSRPYRLALPLNVAIAELKRCTGTQFDPRLSETMVTLIQRGLVKPAEGAELGSCDAFEGDRP